MRHRRRGEAQVEYVIIAIVVSTCAVAGLLVAGAGSLRSVAEASNLCVVEAGECDKVGTGEEDPLQTGEDSEGEYAADADASDADSEESDADPDEGAVDAEGVDGSSEDELLGPRVEKLNPDGTIKDGSQPSADELAQLGPLKAPPPPPVVDPFGLRSAFSSVLNAGYGQSLYLSFQGLLGWFRR